MLQGGTIYRPAGRDEFMFALARARRMRGDAGLCVSDPAKGARLFLSSDGASGFALSGGDLGAVFSAAKGRLSGIMRAAKAVAARAGHGTIHIDCFAPLVGIYARHGFIETGRVAFDWQYAPDGWTRDMGEPDVVFMALPFLSDAAEAA